MAGPVEVVPFENAVRCEQVSHTSWHIIEVRSGVQVASVSADADRVWDIVRLINDSIAARREHHRMVSGEGDDRLTLDFEAGELAKVAGVRPEQMDGYALIRMVKRLARLNLEQELEIGRYKAEAAETEAQAQHVFPQAFSYKDRSIATGGLTKREWFAGQVLADVWKGVAELVDAGSFNEVRESLGLPGEDNVWRIAAVVAFKIADEAVAQGAKPVSP